LNASIRNREDKQILKFINIDNKIYVNTKFINEKNNNVGYYKSIECVHDNDVEDELKVDYFP